MYINKWVHINYCLPHKVHNVNIFPDSNITITVGAVFVKYMYATPTVLNIKKPLLGHMGWLYILLHF